MATNRELVHEYFFSDDISEEALELVNDYAAVIFRESEFIKDFQEEGEPLPTLEQIHFNGMHTDFLIQASQEQKSWMYFETLAMMVSDGKL